MFMPTHTFVHGGERLLIVGVEQLLMELARQSSAVNARPHWRDRMWSPGESRRVLAALCLLFGLLLSPQVLAHGSHNVSARYSGAHASTSNNTAYVRSASANHSRESGECGASVCCGSACATSAFVIVREVVLPGPFCNAHRVEFLEISSIAGLGPQRIRRPPKA